MKVESVNKTKVSTGGSINTLGTVEIADEDIGHLFSIITERMYEDPVRAISRELITNMCDAAMQYRDVHGDMPPAGHVELPTYLSPKIRFVDYGIGMSITDIKEYICKILRSSKRDSNKYHGGFGLGMKSPFSYTKAWYIEARQQGIKHRVTTYMDDRGLPQVSLIGEAEDTDEHDGLTIEIPVTDEDQEAFRKWTCWYLNYIPESLVKKPLVSNPLPDISYDPDLQGSVIVQNEDDEDLEIEFKIRTEDGYSSGRSRYAYDRHGHSQYKTEHKIRLLLGNVVYEGLPNGCDEQTLKDIPIDIFIPIGYLQVTPDRDRLVSNQKQIDRVDHITKEIHPFLEQHMQEIVKDKSLDEIWQLINNAGISNPTLSKMVGTINRHGYEFTYGYRGFQIERKDQYEALEKCLELVNDDDSVDLSEYEWDLRVKDRRRSWDSVGEDYYNSKWLDTTYPGVIHRPHELMHIFVDDMGLGAVTRHKQAYTGDIPSVHLTIRVKVPGELKTSLKITDKALLADIFGVGLDKIMYLSEAMYEKEEDDSTTPSRSSVSIKDLNKIEDIFSSHSLIHRYSKNHAGTTYGRHCYPAGEPLTDRDWVYIVNRAGTIQEFQFPRTTGSKMPEAWNGLSRDPRIFPVEMNLITIPANLVEHVEDLDNWTEFGDWVRSKVDEAIAEFNMTSTKDFGFELFRYMGVEAYDTRRILEKLPDLCSRLNAPMPQKLQDLVDALINEVPANLFIWTRQYIQDLLEEKLDSTFDEAEKWKEEMIQKLTELSLQFPCLQHIDDVSLLDIHSGNDAAKRILEILLEEKITNDNSMEDAA